MAPGDRTVRLQPDAHELLVQEAARRGVEPGALADEIVQGGLDFAARGDLDSTLDALAEFRADLPPIDAVALVRAGRAGPDTRGG